MTESLKQPIYKKVVPTFATNSSVSPMTEPSKTEQELREDIAEIMLEVRQYLINTEFSPEPFTEPVDVDVLKVKFPKKILACVKKAGYLSREEVVEFLVSHKRSYYAKPDGTIILVTSAEWTEQEWESLIKGVAL